MARVDIIFRELNDKLTGDNEVAAIVHSASTDAANKALIAALAAGRNVVVDGTMSWPPFVRQQIAMIREAHNCQFQLGPGWLPESNKEEYFTPGEQFVSPRKPYRIKMVGVTCDPAVAIARGFRRKIISGRGVPLLPQIRSHRLYSQHFLEYASLCDECSLYDTTKETVQIAQVSVENGRRASHLQCARVRG